MDTTQVSAAGNNTAAFFLLVNHPLKFRLFLLMNLPSAFFSGLKIIHADPASCVVSVPYKWFTQNPFRSTYFACLGMAAELSTGVLAMANTYGRKPAVSMLVTKMESRFHKKAKETTLFHCNDGVAISTAVAMATASGEAQEVKAYSTGKNKGGEVVAEFWITWSFKAK